MKKYIKNQKGVTLTEVLIALAIISIAGAIIVPSFGIVHRNRLKNMSSQMSMDIQKVRFFAQTHINKEEDGQYKYKIVFENTENIDGKTYYKNYHMEPKEIFKDYSIGDDLVKIRPTARHADQDKLIKEIQFDNRGRMQVVLAEEEKTIDFLDLILTKENEEEKINITLQIDDKYKKIISVNGLTGKTIITD